MIRYLEIQTLRRPKCRSVEKRAATLLLMRVSRSGWRCSKITHGGKRLIFSFVWGWAGDARSLSKAMDARERHPRAWLAREILLALPHEWTAQQHREGCEKLATFLFDRYRTPLIAAIYEPGSSEDLNWHAKFLVATRSLNEQGALDRKVRELDMATTSGSHLKAIHDAWVSICGLDESALAERRRFRPPEKKQRNPSLRRKQRDNLDLIESLSRELHDLESQIQLLDAG